MKFGVCMFPTEYAMHPASLGKAVESRGFESLFFPEHTHIPSNRVSHRPSSTAELPEEYSNTLDPFVALTAVAGATRNLLIGTGICLVVERDPIILAKEVASLDHLAGGRFLFGIGGGWNREEMENHGTDFTSRWKLQRERVEAIKQIWSNEAASYHGEFVNFDGIWSWPKPLQEPHPPILVGGEHPNNMKRVVKYGDQWMPHPRDKRTFADEVKQLNELAAAAGRGPIPVSLFDVEPEAELVEQFEKDGVGRCIFRLPPAGADEVLPRLDSLAAFVQGRS
jgi:probable F420-dependent oxidoreductase